MDELTHGDEVIEQYWPYDGPHDDHTTQQAAVAMAHLARYLANATGPGHRQDALPYAAVGNAVVGNLASMTGRLTEVLMQLAGFFGAQASDPTLYDDRRRGPKPQHAPTVANTAAAYLVDARSAAAELLHLLKTTQSNSVHLGNDDLPSPGEDGHALGSSVVADTDRRDREGL